ncbi:hypothetical protein [Halobacteriovorax sp. JY17]|uniref:hypothetical protein n=1 Tax=Halobacteriovorax sp. JY17 TaxID=2014617 RepID=UPI000C619480|nr:hypothetical protein [Halobacteriovorax sp. JY17]PIK14644.1 MAG: hypothetical protein CES88_09910 [Halobacteriovorax sp. JY17]
MDLLLTERMVLEAIADQGRTIEEISESTGLKKVIINNILPEFLMKNIIQYKNKKYSLDRETNPNWIREVNRPENTRLELKEILSSSVSLVESGTSLNLKKLYLSEFEEKLLSIELEKVDKLIKDLQKSTKERGRVKDMKIVYWGYAGYGEIIEAQASSL